MGKIPCLEILLFDSTEKSRDDQRVVLEKITGSILNLMNYEFIESLDIRELKVGNKDYRVVFDDYGDGVRCRVLKTRGFGSKEVTKALKLVSKTDYLSLRVGTFPEELLKPKRERKKQ
jgi:hypothetical protein